MLQSSDLFALHKKIKLIGANRILDYILSDKQNVTCSVNLIYKKEETYIKEDSDNESVDNEFVDNKSVQILKPIKRYIPSSE